MSTPSSTIGHDHALCNHCTLQHDALCSVHTLAQRLNTLHVDVTDGGDQ